MDKKLNHRVPLRDLNLADRFLFDEVMEDPQAHRDVLSIILEREVPLLSKNETEKEFRKSPMNRSIRLDVFSVDKENVLYNTEMQNRRKGDLAKRSRYYQALIDTKLLEPGIPNYNLLNTTYIILIATFDIFGHEKYRYTFEASCREVPGCILEDRAVRIFLNTKGTNDEEVPKELADFLHYVENSSDEVAEQSGSERIKRIHKRVCEVKTSEEAGVRYMQEWEEKYYEREEAREEGHQAGLREGHQAGLREGHQAGLREGHQAGLREGHQAGLKEGHQAGCKDTLKELIQKKLAKGKTAEEIADILELDVEEVKELMKEL